MLASGPVDPGGLLTFTVTLPPEQALVGFPVFAQAAGFVHAGTLALSPPIGFLITN